MKGIDEYFWKDAKVLVLLVGELGITKYLCRLVLYLPHSSEIMSDSNGRFTIYSFSIELLVQVVWDAGIFEIGTRMKWTCFYLSLFSDLWWTSLSDMTGLPVNLWSGDGNMGFTSYFYKPKFGDGLVFWSLEMRNWLWTSLLPHPNAQIPMEYPMDIWIRCIIPSVNHSGFLWISFPCAISLLEL